MTIYAGLVRPSWPATPQSLSHAPTLAIGVSIVDSPPEPNCGACDPMPGRLGYDLTRSFTTFDLAPYELMLDGSGIVHPHRPGFSSVLPGPSSSRSLRGVRN
jgi:hypothetical protein